MAAPTVTDVDVPISNVTVYKDRAQVRRSAILSLNAGEHKVVFNGVWGSADRDSLQLATGAGGDKVLLRSVQFTTKETKEDLNPRRKELKEKLEGIASEEAGLKDEISLCATRREALDLMIKKTTFHTKQHNASVYDTDNWAKLSAFVRAQTETISKKQAQLDEQSAALRRQRDDVNRDLNNLRGDYRIDSKEVAEATLTLTADTKVKLQLSYIVRNASWKPVYDLRADSIKKQLSVVYNAMVRNSTGEDWKGAQLILSTANPHTGGRAPKLSRWEIGLQRNRRIDMDFLAQDAYSFNDNSNNLMMQQQMMQTQNMMQQQMMPAQMNMMQQQFQPQMQTNMFIPQQQQAPQPPPQVAQSQSAAVANVGGSATFSIPGTHNVNTDNEPVKVTITSATFPVHLRYSSVPKLAPHTYLKAKAINSTDFQLLEGKANVFADNQFVSNTVMTSVAPGEEFWVFLGVDDSVRTDRKFAYKKRSEAGGMLSAKKRVVYFKYDFSVKNAKSTEEEVVIWDSLPISEDKKITMTLVEPNDQSKIVYKTNDLNAIEWFVNLKPGESTKFELIFKVEYPLEERIVGL